MCMNVAAKYIQIHSNMHRTKCAYLNVYRQKIQSDTNRYAPQKQVHICWYVDLKYIHIHADMHLYIGAYLTVSCCMNTALSKHTYSYAQDTAHRKPNTYRYMHIHADKSMCISHMHCAYVICTWMYVVHIYLYMCMY